VQRATGPRLLRDRPRPALDSNPRPRGRWSSTLATGLSLKLSHLDLYVNDCRSLRRGDDVRFSEFVRFVVDKSSTRRRDDFHWRPMSEACLPCHINFTLLGHYETLAVDAARVLRTLGVSGRVKFPEVRVDKLRESEERTRRMFAEVRREDVERLRQFYHDDFQIFGYDPHAY